RFEATGKGVAVITEWLLNEMGKPLEEARIAIQGFGNVGSHAALFLSKKNAKIVAVSNHLGGIFNGDGLDILSLHKRARKSSPSSVLFEYPGPFERITNEELLALDVDVLIPAAVEGVVHERNVSDIKAPILVEAANAPIT